MSASGRNTHSTNCPLPNVGSVSKYMSLTFLPEAVTQPLPPVLKPFGVGAGANKIKPFESPRRLTSVSFIVINVMKLGDNRTFWLISI
jgi:hypothetical protein